MQLSVITATRSRPALLAHCLKLFQQQSHGGLRCEHLVISDGPDPVARQLTGQAGARYFELPTARGHAGAFAKDLGIREARGEFVCFWDDDNFYEPHALVSLYSAAVDVEIGVVRTRHRLRKNVGMVTLPRRWTGRFHPGDIDTMCVCLQRELATRECWGDDCEDPGTDIRWLQKLEQHAPRVRYVPILIGAHL